MPSGILCSSLKLHSPIDACKRTLSSPSGSSGVPAHGDGLLVLLNVLQESESAGELHAGDGLSSLTGVLEGDTEERATALRRLGLVVGVGCVADLSTKSQSAPNSLIFTIPTSPVGPIDSVAPSFRFVHSSKSRRPVIASFGGTSTRNFEICEPWKIGNRSGER
jgi:hypothetical protein